MKCGLTRTYAGFLNAQTYLLTLLEQALGCIALTSFGWWGCRPQMQAWMHPYQVAGLRSWMVLATLMSTQVATKNESNVGCRGATQEAGVGEKQGAIPSMSFGSRDKRAFSTTLMTTKVPVRPMPAEQCTTGGPAWAGSEELSRCAMRRKGRVLSGVPKSGHLNTQHDTHV